MKKRLIAFISLAIVFSMFVSAVVYADDYELPKVTVTKATTSKETTTGETSVTEPTIIDLTDEYNHGYECFVGYDEEEMIYYCPECDRNIYVPAKYVLEKWDSVFINDSPYNIDNGILFDVVEDGVINVKDYALLLQHAEE